MEHNQRYSVFVLAIFCMKNERGEKKGLNESWGKKNWWPFKEKYRNNKVESFYKCHKSLATKDFKKLSKSSCKLVFFPPPSHLSPLV